LKYLLVKIIGNAGACIFNADIEVARIPRHDNAGRLWQALGLLFQIT